MITAAHSSVELYTAIANVTSQVNRNTQFSASRHPKTICALRQNLPQLVTSGKGTHKPYLVTIGWGLLPMWVKY